MGETFCKLDMEEPHLLLVINCKSFVVDSLDGRIGLAAQHDTDVNGNINARSNFFSDLIYFLNQHKHNFKRYCSVGVAIRTYRWRWLGFVP